MPPLYFWIGWREWSFSDFREGQWADLLTKSHFSVIKETLKSPYSGLSGGPGDVVRVFLILMIFFFLEFVAVSTYGLRVNHKPGARATGGNRRVRTSDFMGLPFWRQ